MVVGRAPVGTSGRNTREQVASQLTVTGMYSLVRHPLYLGNYLIIIGITLWLHNWWLVLLTSCGFALYYERIMLAEEVFLRTKYGEAFENWAAVTPAFIPKWRGWKASPNSFCWRTVLQREYNAFILIIAVFWLFDLIGDSIAERRFHVPPDWLWVFIVGLVIAGTLRYLKKCTHVLDVEGR